MQAHNLTNRQRTTINAYRQRGIELNRNLERNNENLIIINNQDEALQARTNLMMNEERIIANTFISFFTGRSTLQDSEGNLEALFLQNIRLMTSVAIVNQEIRLEDIFWETELSNLFSVFLSVEAKKTQMVNNQTLLPLVSEIGFFANIVSGTTKRSYGYYTGINPVHLDRNHHLKTRDIKDIILHIANNFIQLNEDKVLKQARQHANVRQIVNDIENERLLNNLNRMSMEAT